MNYTHLIVKWCKFINIWTCNALCSQYKTQSLSLVLKRELTDTHSTKSLCWSSSCCISMRTPGRLSYILKASLIQFLIQVYLLGRNEIWCAEDYPQKRKRKHWAKDAILRHLPEMISQMWVTWHPVCIIYVRLCQGPPNGIWKPHTLFASICIFKDMFIISNHQEQRWKYVI